MKKKRNDAFILGAALFSMFFGAGNLIFPPFLGLLAGQKWNWSIFGFFITGIGLPLLGIMASAKAGGDVDKLGRRVSPLFSKFLGITVVLAIGPLLAIPRTGATAFEIGVLPIMPNGNPTIFAILYFGLTLLLVIKPNGVIDKIGKILTPTLLILLGLIIVKGILDPMGMPVPESFARPFSEGFISGYQTMDALASILFGGIITTSLIQSGYDDEKDQISMTKKAGLIAVGGLTIVYGGLGYLGATGGSLFSKDIEKVELIVNIADNSLESFGKIGLGLVVSLACLTTTIGLTATVGEYFSKISKGKLKYETIVIATTIFSAIMSVRGVESIISFSEPILVFMYPVVIVMILLTMILGNKPNKNIYRHAIYATLIVSTLELLYRFKIWTYFTHIVKYLPLASWGLSWLVPAILGAVLGMLLPDKSDIQIS
ncbi:branched-chain amino acid transport system II carrier protein [Tissierella praeacuta]|uniref:branched-chain amino acid transport system II carrier protein n=1 Tax=Tissierella praeacuta TaxID=43131 RepID=UPI00333E8045